jgi:3-deoxy-D-manno-octulosonic-acid transferase
MWRLCLAAYSTLYSAAVLVWLVAARLGLTRRGKQTAILPRLGRHRGLAAYPVPQGTRVWVHAVSVGEVNAVRPLVDALAARPGIRIMLSTVTSTGRRVAADRFGNRVELIPFPVDLGWSCRRFLKHFRPDLILLAESELWPNFLAAAAGEGVPVVLVNGRISDRSFGRYRRLSWFFTPLVRMISHACMQSRQDKERLLALGADPKRVNWAGNLKFDCTVEPDPSFEPLRRLIAGLLKPRAESLLWVCGSTKPGEEEILLSIFDRLRHEFPGLSLLLAPRHPHRAPEVLELARQQGLNAERRTRLVPESVPNGLQVLVLDTVGELSRLYELADLVFVGGSLVPEGGQNPIEPAFFGKPILVGPDMSNFQEVTRVFREAYGVLQVKDPGELEQRMRDLLRDAHAREWLGRNARKVIRQSQGAVQRTLEIVDRHLEVRQ